MYQDHPVRNNSDTDSLISLIQPHMDSVDLNRDVTDRMETLHAMAELDGGKVTDLTKQLMVLIEKKVITHDQTLKILARRYSKI